MLRVEVEPGHLPVQGVEEGHPLGDVQGELQRARGVHHQTGGTLVQNLRRDLKAP